ncbi:hypothetical protein [Actinomadura sp. HBU206391]|uniref:hypothetical protein n=1 Tax=Actinomadura sp. HBU206391 TaxID=2731692 RepID=UPI0016506B89|nr:hypothetical protein [Actinomadura sp. HBU206391]MBC6462805.1 hypothetical protein [Actinomadura sp. HBU206391]
MAELLDCLAVEIGDLAFGGIVFGVGLGHLVNTLPPISGDQRDQGTDPGGCG